MASTTSKGGPLQTVKAFLACVKTKDVQHMREFAHPDATACLIGEGEPRFMALDEAIERLAKAEGQLVEEIWDEVEHRDGDYATVWSTFSIHGDGQLLQLGSSSFSCWNSSAMGWIILTMSDVARNQKSTDSG